MPETTETIILDLQFKETKPVNEQKKEVDALAGSILGLQQANKKLRDERKLLDTTTAEGSKRIKEINSLIDQNDKVIKANSSSLEKQRLNIGNYTGALDKLIPGLGATIQGISGMTKAAWAFVANPIGAVLVALGLALGALVAYFKGSEEGADKFAKVSAQLSAIVSVLFDRVAALGGALVAFLSGDISGGIDRMKGAFSGLGDEIEREARLAGELAEIIDELGNREIDYSVAASKTTNEIKKLVIESKNRNLTEQERIDKLKEAIDLEVKQNEVLKAINLDKVRVAVKQLELNNSQLNLQRKKDESELEYATRLTGMREVKEDDLKNLASALIALNSTEGESLTLQEKITNQTEALNEKLQERIDKEAALNEQVRLYIEAFNEKLNADRVAFEQEQLQSAERSMMSEKFISELGVNTKAQLNASDIVTKRKKQQADDEVKYKKQSAELSKKIEEDAAKFTAKLLGEGATLFKEHTIAYKVLASGKAIANTFLGVTEVLKTESVLPEPAATIGRIVSIAAVIGSGLKAVAEINKVKLAFGGRADKQGVFNGPSHAGGGIDYVRSDGKHRINVEGDEAFFVLKKSATREIGALSALNQRHGGASFGNYPGMKKHMALGGQVPTGNRRDSTEDVVRSVMANMPPIYVVAQDVSEVLTVDNNIKTKAQVI